MKKKMNQWINKSLLSMSGLLTLAMTSPSQAAVTVYFEQDGPDVTATWVGSLDPGQFDTDFFSVPGSSVSSNQLVSSTSDNVDFYFRGSARRTPLMVGSFASTLDPDRSYGFSEDEFFVSASLNDVADFDSANPIMFNALDDVMVIPGQSLVGIGADGYADTLAWTSSTGDTVSFTTGPVPVPEPSSAILVLSACLSGLLRRKRG